MTVVIPTCKRPLFLRTALSSVQRQTARAEITEVVVIENGGSRDSETVCREFDQLPIRYVFRDPPLAPENGMRPMVREMREGLVALLFDDDWWDSRHLENARRALERHSDASAYFSAEHYTTGESKPVTTTGTWLHWFAVNGREQDGLHLFSFADAVAVCLLVVPGHFSTLVTTRSTWERCLGVSDHGNPFDVDRLLFVELSKHGPVIFNTRPNAYVRVHQGQEYRRISSSGDGLRWWLDSTRRILEAAREQGIDVKQVYAERVASGGSVLLSLMPRTELGRFDALAEGGWLPGEFMQSLRWHRRKSIIRRWIPPVLWDGFSALKKRVRQQRG